MIPYRSLRLFFFLSLFLASPSLAQMATVDPRPLHANIDSITASIPHYNSFKDFLDHYRGPANLNGNAELEGVFRAVSRPVPIADYPMQPLNGGSKVPDFGSNAPQVWTAPNGTVRWMEGKLGSIFSHRTGENLVSSTSDNEHLATSAATAILQKFSHTLLLNNPASELQAIQSTTDALGYIHVRFQQQYQGLPIWDRDLWVHFDAHGDAYAINGEYEPTPDNNAFAPFKGKVLTPTLSGTDAINAVIADCKSRGSWHPFSDAAMKLLRIGSIRTQLLLYPHSDGKLHLAYEVIANPNVVEEYSYLIDATTGEQLIRIPRFCSVKETADWTSPAPKLSVSAPYGAKTTILSGGFNDATGTDLNGRSRNFRTFLNTDGTSYLVWDLPNFDAGHSTMPATPAGGSMVLTANNTDQNQSSNWTQVSSADNTWSDPATVSAHTNGQIAYNYYVTTHHRKSIDGSDGTVIGIVHVTKNGGGLDNAFWNGQFMVYGDGLTSFKPLAGGLDVAGHEMTHGVVQHSAGFPYLRQPGALNESFADIFGIMIDRANFTLGEDIMAPGQGTCLRDISDPHNLSGLSHQPANMDEYKNLPDDQDFGGVHTNSGIPNKAAYLIIQSIGREKTEKIYYRALTTYLTRNSQFIDCRLAVEHAAKDLFGDNAEAQAVRSAFDAVGILAGTGTDSRAGDVLPVTGGLSLITFMIDDGTLGVLDVAKGVSALYSTPKAQARVSTTTILDRAQISTARNGKRIFYIDPSGHLEWVKVIGDSIFFLPGLHIANDGDLWNASIAPDENFVAFTSAYAHDPNLYISDFQSIVATVPLKPETSQAGVESQTVQYPDVVSWSPNATTQKIAFDALNKVREGADSIVYWTMDEINFKLGKVFDLVPTQPRGVDVGNITYSNTSPNVIAFNSVQNSEYDIVLANFKTDSSVALQMPTRNLDGHTPIVDAQRPTFSPVDAALCFTTPAQSALLFFSLQTGTFFAKPMPVPVFNPRWFVTGGTVNGVATAAHNVRLLQAFPNPVSGLAQIRFDLISPEKIQLYLVDMLGRTVWSRAEETLSTGTQNIALDVSKLAAGPYWIQLESNGPKATHEQALINVVH